jgi:uncharacterized ferritin-like protein (DUF455 family)
VDRPAPETREAWALDYIESTDLEYKFAPPPLPDAWAERAPAPQVVNAPGRPAALVVAPRSAKTPRPGALQRPEARARILHTFLHHELQAAELMAWALLAFPDTPREFRAGLLDICLDEVRHMGFYRAHIETLGHAVGDFDVRDWFWERVPLCRTATEFVAVLGMGFEGGNLEHAQIFATRFRSAGDEDGARLQERVGAEEIAHVRFAVRWFETWTGGQDFKVWLEHLPAPLSPTLMRGDPLRPELRRRAGLDAAFIKELQAWQPLPSGS